MSKAKPSTRKTLENYIFKKMSDQGIVGLSIATIKDGKPDYQRGFGFRNFVKGTSSTPNTIYCIGSLTKAFTASAIMQLSEKEILNLEDPIGKYLPIELTAMGEPVLIEHVLSHSSGLSALGYAEATLTSVTDFSDHWLPISSAEDLMIFMHGADEWAMAKPGERYAYLNEGYIMLGSIIKAVSGMEYADYVKKNILEPLNMNRSTYYESDIEEDPDIATPYVSGANGEKVETRYPYGQMISDGGLMSNVVDLVKFVQMFISGDRGEKVSILSKESIKDMITPKIKTNDIPLGNAGPRHYAYGFRVKSGFFGYNLVYHSGSVFGSSAYMAFIPEKKVGVVIMASGGYFLEDIGELAIAQLLGVNPDDVPYFKRIEQLDDLTGTYITFRNTSEYEVKRDRGILHLETSFFQRTWTTPLIPLDLEGDVKRFMVYGLETMTPVEFVWREGELLMFYENTLAKRVNGW
jgi:CubicO group peptidase (beta-lactamase class C family)